MTFEMEPTFTVGMRGYDRQQVDDYTATLRRMLEDAQRRAYAAAEAQAAAERRAGQHADNGATPMPAVTGSPEPPPASAFAGLGAHIETMLRLAEQQAAELRAQGEQQAAELLSQAEQEAERVRRSASDDVEAVQERRANSQREADQIIEAARGQAEDLLSRARHHAENQAEGIVTQAEADARRILDEARETGQVRLAEAEARRQELATAIETLTDRHRRIMEDLARVRAALDADPDIAKQAAEIRLDDNPVNP